MKFKIIRDEIVQQHLNYLNICTYCFCIVAIAVFAIAVFANMLKAILCCRNLHFSQEGTCLDEFLKWGNLKYQKETDLRSQNM